MGGVDDQAESVEASAGKWRRGNRRRGGRGLVDGQGGGAEGDAVVERGENLLLDRVFLGVGELEAGVIEDLDAVVAVRLWEAEIMTPAAKDAGAGNVGHAGRGD